MSDSIEYILAERAKKDASIREALAVYHDLCFDGDYLAAGSLKLEDCDTIVCMDGPDGTRLRAGRRFEHVVVLRDWTNTQHVAVFLRQVEIHDKVLYRQILAAMKGGSR